MQYDSNGTINIIEYKESIQKLEYFIENQIKNLQNEKSTDTMIEIKQGLLAEIQRMITIQCELSLEYELSWKNIKQKINEKYDTFALKTTKIAGVIRGEYKKVKDKIWQIEEKRC